MTDAERPATTGLLDRQATSVWTADRDAHDRLGARWAGGSQNVFDSRTQASAMSALLGAVVAPG